ncbi:MAG TPA: nuclear transport factor 2 family protein [Candidatus Hydrogenedentes bacterium]|nr:nuclear transport factor 2 family protein [Candidatus Hydrogenedentota bacterium]HPU98487.1 nuclear transport factor 2 family protein [Candidatus Hydrogenedentota bacterium]
MNHPGWGALLAVGLLALAGGCQSVQVDSLFWRSAGVTQVDAETRVRQVLDEVQAGMQRESLFQVMGHVSLNYRDKAGRDYAGIREYLRQVFERYRNIRIVRTPPSVEIQGQYARAVESFGAMADPADSSGLPINIQGQTVVLLERIDGDWKILEWGPLY